jgi:hypothetical protein
VAYCPKCGDPFDQADGQLRCVRGNMQVSAHLTELIRAGLRAPGPSSGDVRPTAEVSDGSSGVAWFCPRCAAVLPGAGTNLACRSCGYLLTWAQRYALIESHPHGAWPPMRHLTLLDRLGIQWARLAVWLRSRV